MVYYEYNRVIEGRLCIALVKPVVRNQISSRGSQSTLVTFLVTIELLPWII